jgi:hypothetical protein
MKTIDGTNFHAVRVFTSDATIQYDKRHFAFSPEPEPRQAPILLQNSPGSKPAILHGRLLSR